MKVGKRVIIKVISFILAFGIVILGTVLTVEKRLKHYETQIAYAYSMHLNELDGSLYNISVALQKSLYASSATQLSLLAVELCTESSTAKNALSQLPLSADELSNVNKLLSQVGDYTLHLSRKVIQGGNIEQKDRENLHSLSKAAQSVSSSINTLRSEYDREGVWSSELTAEVEQSAGEFSTQLEGLEQLLVDYPSLQYDGPFSDHLLDGEMKMLFDKPEITQEEALNNAAAIMGIDTSNFKAEEETAGNVPCYNFTDGEMSFSVTKQGGYIIYMRKSRDIGDETLTYAQAVEKAAEYLNESSKSEFVSTYYFADEGICTVNFAHKEGVTVCYPDLIKVGVSLDNGEIVLLEAAGYLANHYNRTISTPKYTVNEAKEKLSPTLKINDVKRCIIPTEGKYEKHCYEFQCVGIDGEELLIYVNVANLEEEQILLLLKTDGGTLTK